MCAPESQLVQATMRCVRGAFNLNSGVYGTLLKLNNNSDNNSLWKFLFWCCDACIRKMIMTSLIRLIVKVYKWLTFFKEAKQFGLVGPVWGCCHERQFNKHVQKSKRAKERNKNSRRMQRETFALLRWAWLEHFTTSKKIIWRAFHSSTGY